MLREFKIALYRPYTLFYGAPMRANTVQDARSYKSGKTSSNPVTVYKAAEELGITVDAVRKRIQRGTIPHERSEDGRVYVLLDTSSNVHDNDKDGYRTQKDALVENLQEQIEYLRSVLATRDEEIRRRDHIIAGLVEHVPALEGPSEPRDGRETAMEGQDRGKGRDTPQKDTQRPWWRRVMFGE